MGEIAEPSRGKVEMPDLDWRALGDLRPEDVEWLERQAQVMERAYLHCSRGGARGLAEGVAREVGTIRRVTAAVRYLHLAVPGDATMLARLRTALQAEHPDMTPAEWDRLYVAVNAAFYAGGRARRLGS